jgi:lysophospholipid acyltransferase (LPLAT)-like uncharacterized protein
LKIRLRNLFNRFPVLDGLRLSCLAWICDHGTTFFERTYRITSLASPGAKPYLANADKGAIFAVYHGRMVGLLGLKPRKKLTILISNSRDGEIIARACLGLGFSIARGSPAEGAVRGTRQMVTASQSRQRLAFIIDGPRGPIYSVKKGIIRLAAITGLPIVPFICQARTYYSMKTWDKFMAPWWGTPIVYLFGDPLHVPKNPSQDQEAQLEQSLGATMANLRDLAACFFDHCTP